MRRLVLFAAGALAAVLVALVVAAGRGGEESASAQMRPEAQSEPAILVPEESEGALLEPPKIASRKGVLKATATLIRAGTPGSNRPTLFGGLPTYSKPAPPSSPPIPPPPAPVPAPRGGPPHLPLDFAAGFRFTTADGKTYPAQFPGPTLRVEPGDTLDLKMRNRLGAEPSGPRLPKGAALTDLHSHGMVVSPLGDGDNVYRTMEAGGTYRTRIKVPVTAQSGYDWYHPHRHGFVSDQVYGGLAGTLQVGSPLDPWPQYKGKFKERVLALTAGMISVDPRTGLRVVDDPNPAGDPASLGPLLPYGRIDTWRKFVNGQYNPTITIRPGETQVWNFASMTRNGNFNLGITDADGQNPWSATILAYDGNGRNLHPRPITLAPPVPYVFNGPTVLDEGARLTMAVTAPTRPGTYYLVDDMTLKRRPQSRFFALATITVEGDPVTERPPVFTPTGHVPDLFTATPDHKRTFIFSNDTSGKTIRFAINGSFFPDGPIVPLQVGQVEEWWLINTSPVDHIFHIHQTDFAVISVNAAPFDYKNPFVDSNPFQYVSLRDSVNIPPGGNVVIRFRVSPELGKYVFHCHILAHEDGGMMTAVLAVPNETQRRIALGTPPGRGSTVLVKDGNGRALRPVPPQPGDAMGGAATATGDINGDLVEDIVVGRPARPGSLASVSVYDGKGLRRTGRFRPFPETPRAGVSVATGDIDRDGRAEIIVGRVGRGASLARIFHADGRLFRTIRHALPGRLPTGVTVTSADFNGDNYDDLAIGASSGRAPRVVGLDGFTLGGRRRPPARLFSFRAAGGRSSGVNLASGYFDPRTRPGLAANLITTPQTGRLTGEVQVWTPMREAHEPSARAAHAHSRAGHRGTAPSPPRIRPATLAHSRSGSPTASGFTLWCKLARAASPRTQALSLAAHVRLTAASESTTARSPRLMATLHPRGRRVHQGLRLAVTRLGKQGVNTLVAWADPRKPAYVSINVRGVVSRIQAPIHRRR
jgi:FtsP/CotA-like multicopper oxidase with cupredoxin domain